MPSGAPVPAAPSAAPRALVAAGIAGLGVATPATVVDNRAIASRLGLADGWIETRTGISERRHAAPGERLTDLAALAGARALEAAGTDAAALDLVVVATTTPDQVMPNAAPLVAHALGAPSGAGAFDVGSACTGFVNALDGAAAMVEAGRATTALVIGADMMSRLLDPEDRNTSIIFGDGAGAAVLSAAPGHGRIGPSVLGCDGEQAELVCVPRETGTMRMAGQDTFRHAVARLTAATGEAAARSGLELGDIDLFVYHQANARILRAVGERLGADMDRVVDCIARYGNTSAATIPIALAEARDAGRLFPGARVLIGAFGAGLTWGATVIEWGDA
ncbi:MAG: beta-ketoacyl-ACP synthase 3 [Solirubrobacterales bacterium]|nr:beta-ketoacyl-ACP synthase 3 [Solirubrobacterales bacterium]